MVNKHGLKTVEREHVYSNIKKDNFINAKAWGKLPLCLSFLVIGVFVGTPMALAQSNDFSSRLNRLENELETLNRAVYNGERPPQNIYTSEVTPSNQTSNRAAAQMEIRLQQIETQMRELTGRIEEQMFTINQLKQDVQTLQAAKINTQTSIDTTSSNVSNNANVSNNNTTALEWKNEDEGMEAATSFVSTGDATALYESAFASLKNKEYKVSRGKRVPRISR